MRFRLAAAISTRRLRGLPCELSLIPNARRPPVALNGPRREDHYGFVGLFGCLAAASLSRLARLCLHPTALAALREFFVGDFSRC
jgi:hypothetical protein